MINQRLRQFTPDASYNLFEQSLSKKLIEANMLMGENEEVSEVTQDAIESLSRLSPSILIGPGQGNYVTSLQQGEAIQGSNLMNRDEMRCSENSEVERRRISQERNRLAAIKSRLKKKQEWYRLLESERNLRAENEGLKQRVHQLEILLHGSKNASELMDKQRKC
jgi:hypothetical protein